MPLLEVDRRSDIAHRREQKTRLSPITQVCDRAVALSSLAPQEPLIHRGTRVAYSRPMNHAWRWIRNAVLVAILAAAAMTFGCGGLVRTMMLRQVSGLVLQPPSDRDRFFNLVAVDFNQPALCDRIDWRADASTGGWGAPFQIRTMRSECRSNLELPANVISSEVPDSKTTFAGQIRALGYTDADVTQAAYVENWEFTPIYPVYRDLLASNDFRSRLRAAPGYGEPRDSARIRPATPVEFMYQMVAVDVPEAALCSKISPNATFTDLGGQTALLQSRCYLHIAFNTRDLRLCEPLPFAGSFPHINEGYDSRERCRDTVAIYSRPDYKSNATYGAAQFPHAADFQKILREIGYDDKSLPQVPVATADEYWEFVSRLIHRGPASDRDEFLRRVEALE